MAMRVGRAIAPWFWGECHMLMGWGHIETSNPMRGNVVICTQEMRDRRAVRRAAEARTAPGDHPLGASLPPASSQGTPSCVPRSPPFRLDY